MRKFAYLLAITTLVLVSCGTKGYKITGTMDGAVDGDRVYIMDRVNRQFVSIDSAVISNGQFVFTGVQDSAVNRYLTYMGEDDLQPVYVDFFLENGNINVKMRAEGGDVVSGTPTNDAFQTFKDKLLATYIQQREIRAAALATVTPEEKETKMKELEKAEASIVATIKASIEQNTDTPLGLYLLNSNYYYFEYDELGELLAKFPDKYQSDKNIIRLKDLVDVAKATAVGQKFVDFELQDPSGNPVKLSDYAGKGKLVLVDFWASWCGPCREEMPKLIEAYAKYKDKNFEIVGVSLDKAADSWQKGIEQLGITWPQISDLKYWDSEGAKLYAVRSIPHVVLIDGEGTIISRGLHGDTLREKLAELLDN